MKTIHVSISGRVVVFNASLPIQEVSAEKVEEYEYLADLIDDGLVVREQNHEFAFFKDLEYVMYDIDGDEDAIDITKKKGKYLETKTFWEDRIKFPFVFQYADDTWAIYDYVIELEDDEEFDPKKLQLVKSDYEVWFLPYGIITEYIMYDGKTINTDSEPEYDIFSCDGCYLYSDAKQWDMRKGGLLQW